MVFSGPRSLQEIRRDYFTRGVNYVDALALVDKGVEIGGRTKIWAYAHIRDGVNIGEDCIIAERVYIGDGSQVANRCKIQNGAQLYSVIVGDGVFIGPGVIFCNDKHPRAVNTNGSLKQPGDWKKVFTHVEAGASIGAGAIILPGVTIGQWAMVGAGAVVTEDVPEYGLAVGNPARVVGWIPDGKLIRDGTDPGDTSTVDNENVKVGI